MATKNSLVKHIRIFNKLKDQGFQETGILFYFYKDGKVYDFTNAKSIEVAVVMYCGGADERI